MDDINTELTISYDPGQKQLYMDEDPKCIYPMWHSKVGIHNKGRNFAAMVARKHFEEKGYSVLKEYLLARCKRQRVYNEGFRTICKIFGKEKMMKVLHASKHLKGGDPDLFIFNQDMSKYFFVEAKATGDKLRPNQIELISIIKKYLCPVYIAHVESY